jgi:hypothetical protein
MISASLQFPFDISYQQSPFDAASRQSDGPHNHAFPQALGASRVPVAHSFAITLARLKPGINCLKQL